MTPDEVALVLTKAATIDQRTIGRADVIAWHEILEPVDLADALDAVKRHYTTTADRLMPAHVLRHARDIREERRRKQGHDVRALPSRYEDDTERDARLRAGSAKVRAVIAPLVKRWSLPGSAT